MAGLVLLALYSLLFLFSGGAGLVSADEPRYAQIGRTMARTGDWVTPVLNGEPWFEKPPLLYWMIAAGWKLGLRDEAAARVPVAAVSLAFLWLVWRRVGRDAALMLGTTAGYVAYSSVAVTDLPLTAAFGAAMLLALPGEGKRLPLACGVLLGLAMLAKALVPAVLALPAVWFWRRQPGRLLAVALIAGAMFGSWFLLAAMRNGAQPWEELIVKHHFARFAGGAIHHERPFWFYAPVLLAGLVPWAPALFRVRFDHPHARYYAAWAGFGFLFFSASANKLPGYLLPLLPAVIALASLRPLSGWTLRACAACVPVVIYASRLAAPALADGLSRTALPAPGVLEIGLLAAALAPWPSAPPVAALAAVCMIFAKSVVAQALVPGSVRAFHQAHAHRAEQLCLDRVDRDERYALDYYFDPRLPDCETNPRPLPVFQEPGKPLSLGGLPE